MAQPLDWPLERYRALLKMQVRQLQLDPRLQRRFDSSDLVQDALAKALQGIDQFRGTSEVELLKWLQRILRNTVHDKIDEEYAQNRDIRREQPMQDAAAESSNRWEKVLVDSQDGPDREAEGREFFLRLAAAIDQLPDDQRDAFILVHFMGIKVAQAAERLGRTEKSVAGLVRRAREKLCELLPEYNRADPWETHHGR
jgi:RNA polymerase sigma-70 factor (ECF subfamily)